MRKYILIILFISCNSLFIYSQCSLEGNIKNKTGENLPYASIYLLYTQKGTISNEEGNFNLKINSINPTQKKDTLVISYIGYKEQRIPVFLKNNILTFKISLEQSSINLEGIVVKAGKLYSPEEIIEKAIQQTKQNYSQEQVLMNGFYRELVKEEKTWIQLNEASVILNYSPYPQKGFTKKSFRNYWNNGYTMSYGAGLGDVFSFSQFFPYYTPGKDRVKIVSSRFSTNLSQYGSKPTPYGGALDLVAVDKIKYGYNFLDPKLIEKYQYKLLGRENINGNLCYIIEFHPNKKFNERISHNWSKKFEYAIYAGRVYITFNDFAVVGFKCQVASDANLDMYKQVYFYDYIYLEANYKKFDDFWVLNQVKTEQRVSKKIGNKKVPYTCIRELNLSKPQNLKIKFNEEEILPLTHSSTLRFFSNKYNSEYWDSFEKKAGYPAIPAKIKNDLESFAPLKKQFANINLPVDSLKPPVPPKQNFTYEFMDDTLEDKYHWISLEKDSSVLDYIKKENTYYNETMHKIKKYKGSFYASYLNMVKYDTAQHSFLINKGKYIWEQDSTGDIQLYKFDTKAKKEGIFNVSYASKGKKNFFIEKIEPNKKDKLAYLYSTKGDISFTLITKKNGRLTVLDSMNKVSDFIWLNDSVLIYTQVDDTERTCKLFTHQLGSNPAKDNLIYTEKDSTFDISIKESTSGKYIFINRESLDENGIYFINRQLSPIKLNLLIAAKPYQKNKTNHFGDDYFYISTEENNQSKLFSLPVNQITENNRQIIYTTSNTIEDFKVLKDYIVIKEYKNTRLSIIYAHKKDLKFHKFLFREENYVVDFISNYEKESNSFHLNYENPVTPYKLLDIQLDPVKATTLKQDSLYKWHLPENYTTKLIWVKKDKDINIPVTLFYNKNKVKEDFKGIILKAYGAYGAKYYHRFNTENIIFANDGFIVAFAHVRGGSELGNNWYLEGKEINKLNTFEDYICCAKYLKSKYKLSRNQLIGYGQSAGGLIMGYVANNYPELFGTLIFDKPYLDIVNTMKDNKLPLTTMEIKEWGNIKNQEVFSYVKKYSSYQNIQEKNYPNMLFFSKFNDKQTPYWQINKSVAKYREMNSSNSIILINTDMVSGHRGAVNWEKHIDVMADMYSFIRFSLENKSIE